MIKDHRLILRKLNLYENEFQNSNYIPACWGREEDELSTILAYNIKVNNSDVIYLRSEITPGVQVYVLLDRDVYRNLISKDVF